MAKFLSDRQQSLRVGISSYTENNTVLQTIGKVGIGTTNAGGRSLYVIGDTEITGVTTLGVTSTTNLTAQQLNVSGIATLTQISAGGTTGTNQYVLSSTGIGLSWQSVTSMGATSGVSVVDDTSTNESRFLLFTSATSGIIGTENVSSTKLVYNPSSGNVGIGSTLPSSKLDIIGDIKVSGISTLGVTSTTNLTAQQLNVSGISTLQTTTLIGGGTSTGTAGQVLQVAGISSGAYIGGNLGVGSTLPTSKLTVIGNVSISGVTTSTDFNSSSDIALKKDIIKIESPLATIEQLRGVKFTWKSNDKKSIGVIAQEIEEVLPELVSQSDIKSVNYNGLIGVLIEAVKELSVEVESLKQQINNQ